MKQKKNIARKASLPVKKDANTTAGSGISLDETALFERIAMIIENRTTRIERRVNAELTLMYWEIGRFINSVILDGGRGKYRKQILATLSPKLVFIESSFHFVDSMPIRDIIPIWI